MKLFKIGLYVRVSTEEQAENPEGSIKNQEARLREFVKLKKMVGPFGDIHEVFTDAGISAKDMNRPALQRLLNQIRVKEIDMILVTELSRFTRSIKDFSILKEFLEKHECKFLSIKDNFDTSTAAGELVMYMMANIAEFERKQTAERISHSFLARAKRGLYNGGSVPMGYEIDKDKPGSLAIIPEEAEIVRMVFDTFLKEETLAKSAKRLNNTGISLPRKVRGGGPLRSSIFRVEQINKLLRNKAYISVRVFHDKDGNTCESRAVWPPIIDEVTFGRVQRLLTSNRYRKRTHLDQRYPFTLSGVSYCAVCGDRMAGKSAHGRNGKVPYYEHSWSMKNQAALSKKLLKCEPHRLQAVKIEPVVWEAVKSFLFSPEITEGLLATARKLIPENKALAEIERIKRKTQAIALQIETLTERISRLPKGVNEKPFFDQMLKLQDTQEILESQLMTLKSQPQGDDIIALDDLMKFTASLKALINKANTSPDTQTEIIHKIVHRIEIHNNGCEVHFHIGQRHYREEFGERPAPSTESAKLIPLERFRPRTQPLPKFQKDSGSKRLTNGGREVTTNEPLYSHDFIELFPRTPSRIYEECAPLYESGLSIRDIEERTGIPKSTVRETLKKSGMALRNPLNGNAIHIDRLHTKRGGHTPYGYAYLDGKLLIDPKEQIIVRKIIKLHQSGLSGNAIAKELNHQKIPSRSGKSWSPCVVRRIIKLNQSNQQNNRRTK